MRYSCGCFKNCTLQLMRVGLEQSVMEGIGVRCMMIPSSSACRYQRETFRQVSSSPSRSRCRFLRFNIRAKLSDTHFQDFKSYVRPSSLLSASEVKVYTNVAVENILSSLKEDRSKSLFKVKFGTSNLYGSSISDLNAGILLCLIDEDGNSILQRIPASSMMDHSTGDKTNVDMIHFQRGSVDEFIFEGPKIARLEAIWVSVESGQWRLGSISLMVISCEGKPSGLEDWAPRYTGFQYDFQIDDPLLGEGSDLSMLELRPGLVTEVEAVDPISVFDKELNDRALLSSPMISNEESMREYADLKFSLLFYDAILTLFGTSVSSLLGGEYTGISFFIGGIGGFLYLLLLQRSVDELPASELITRDKGRTNALLRGLKGPIASVILAIGFGVFAANYSSGDLQVMLTPKDLIVGMMGFFVCKVSVVLAAFKPITVGPKLPNDM